MKALPSWLMSSTGFEVNTPHHVYALGGFNLSVISSTVGTLEQGLPKQDERNMEMASGIEVNEEQPRSDDDDT